MHAYKRLRLSTSPPPPHTHTHTHSKLRSKKVRVHQNLMEVGLQHPPPPPPPLRSKKVRIPKTRKTPPPPQEQEGKDPKDKEDTTYLSDICRVTLPLTHLCVPLSLMAMTSLTFGRALDPAPCSSHQVFNESSSWSNSLREEAGEKEKRVRQMHN